VGVGQRALEAARLTRNAAKRKGKLLFFGLLLVLGSNGVCNGCSYQQNQSGPANSPDPYDKVLMTNVLLFESIMRPQNFRVTYRSCSRKVSLAGEVQSWRFMNRWSVQQALAERLQP
jgi:hypothetical protein